MPRGEDAAAGAPAAEAAADAAVGGPEREDAAASGRRVT
jgi:hypothetical protein